MQQQTAHRRRWWTLAVVSLALLTISLDNTILNVALPSIQSDLGATGGELQWIVDAYTLVFAGFVLTAGSLGDRFGRQKALVAGLLIFATGSLAAALSGSPEALTASRAFMGFGAALVMPTTLSVITNVFPAGERGKAIGIWAAVAGIGVAVGPIAGGFLLEHFEWGSVFLVNLPVAAVVLAAARWLVPESRDPEASRLDPIGAGLSAVGLTTLVWAIIEAPDRGWTSGVTLGAFAVALALLVAFARWELRTSSPMLDVRLFKVGAFSGASGAVALAFFSLFGVIFFLTQYLQEVLDYSALEAGVRTLPVAGGLILGGPLSARIAERVGARWVVGAGLAILATALGLLSTVELGTGYGLVAASMAIMGVGMGAAMAPSTESIMSTLPAAHAGVGSAMNDTTRMVGGSLGVAVLGSLLSSGYGDDMERVTEGLDPRAAEAAGESISAAGAVAGRIGGEAGAALAQAADGAFVSAMSTALTVGTGVALAGALFAVVVMPRKQREPKAARAPQAVPA